MGGLYKGVLRYLCRGWGGPPGGQPQHAVPAPSGDLATNWNRLEPNRSFNDVLAVDNYFEAAISNTPSSWYARAWVDLAAEMGNRYQYYARLDPSSLIQPVGVYQRFLKAPRSLFIWCSNTRGGSNECGGALVVMSADAARAISHHVHVPAAGPADDDTALTAWARVASNNTARVCVSNAQETAMLSVGGSLMVPEEERN